LTVVEQNAGRSDGERLEIRLPDEARAALDEQMAAEADGQEPPDPFERGPEITETR